MSSGMGKGAPKGPKQERPAELVSYPEPSLLDVSLAAPPAAAESGAGELVSSPMVTSLARSTTETTSITVVGVGTTELSKNPDTSPRIREGVVVLDGMRDVMNMARHYCRANMVPRGLDGRNQAETESRVAVAIEFGIGLGFTPLQSLSAVCIVNNRPCLYGDSLMSLVVRHKAYGGHKAEWTGEGEKRVCTFTIFRLIAGESKPYSVSFSYADAKRAGLLGKPGPWSLYPDRMVFCRARAFALRDSFPDALNGAGLIEEQESVDNSEEITRALQAKLEGR